MSNDALSDLDAAPAHALAAAIAGGRLGAREACERAIARIERRDGALNAVVVRDFERARAQADRADQALARGERRPLLGVPMTVKESYDVAGLPTTWGLPPFRDHRPTADAVAVARLKAAGAVILGKTNVPPALADWQCANPIYGRTVHPLDHARTPGDSSGGAAAALASGMVPLELGSDIGGSIRVPAAFCGVFGHKPTYGLVPARGHGFPGTDGAEVALAVCGPLARSAADLELALGVVAGPDVDRADGWALSLPAPPAQLAGTRLLALDAHPCARTQRAIAGTVAHVARLASAAGAGVDRESPLLPDLAGAHEAYQRLLTPIVTRGAPNPGPIISAHEWMAALDEQLRAQRRWRALFEHYDAVVTPAFGTVAYPYVEEQSFAARTLTIDGEVTAYGDQLAWPGVATFPGLPATVAPLGATSDGLPIGLQVIGPAWHDRRTIAIAGWLHALARPPA